MTQRTRKK